MPTQLLGGPKAPSGKKTTVRGDVSSVIDLAVQSTRGPVAVHKCLISSRSAMVGITRLAVNERNYTQRHDRSDRRDAGRVRIGGGSAGGEAVGHTSGLGKSRQARGELQR